MTRLLIAVPVLGRPERARPLVETIHEATFHDTVILFMCSPGDEAEIEACQDAIAHWSADSDGDRYVDMVVVEWEAGRGDWARKCNLAFTYARQWDCEWVFTGADDLCFCPGWDVAALACAERSAALVIGTNDLGNARVITGDHSTHSLVHVSYPEKHGTIDELGKLFHEGYDHQFCDDEMVQTAKVRKLFAACTSAEVPHLHPNWGKGVNDPTYEKGQARFWEDRNLFEERSPLWLASSRVVSRGPGGAW